MIQADETAEPLALTAAPGELSETLHYSSDPPPSHVFQASAAILRTTLPVCHVTPCASRQKLNTDIGIIQLATAYLTSWDTAQTEHDNARTQPQRSPPKTQPSFFVPGGPRMRFVRALDAHAPRSF